MVSKESKRLPRCDDQGTRILVRAQYIKLPLPVRRSPLLQSQQIDPGSTTKKRTGRVLDAFRSTLLSMEFDLQKQISTAETSYLPVGDKALRCKAHEQDTVPTTVKVSEVLILKAYMCSSIKVFVGWSHTSDGPKYCIGPG